jgi:hypothetical protein
VSALTDLSLNSSPKSFLGELVGLFIKLPVDVMEA